MAKKSSIEERVVAYFRTAPQAEMELLYRLVSGEVKQRRKAGMQPAPVNVGRKLKKLRADETPEQPQAVGELA